MNVECNRSYISDHVLLCVQTQYRKLKKEHGEDRNDVIVKDIRNGRIAIFEAKYAGKWGALSDACTTAMHKSDQAFFWRKESSGI